MTAFALPSRAGGGRGRDGGAARWVLPKPLPDHLQIIEQLAIIGQQHLDGLWPGPTRSSADDQELGSVSRAEGAQTISTVSPHSRGTSVEGSFPSLSAVALTTTYLAWVALVLELMGVAFQCRGR